MRSHTQLPKWGWTYTIFGSADRLITDLRMKMKEEEKEKEEKEEEKYHSLVLQPPRNCFVDRLTVDVQPTPDLGKPLLENGKNESTQRVRSVVKSTRGKKKREEKRRSEKKREIYPSFVGPTLSSMFPPHATVEASWKRSCWMVK